jgi:hypothetical protein
MKELESGYASAGKTGQAKSATSKTATEMTCGANMMFKMPHGSQFDYNPVLGGSEIFHTHPEGMWMFNVKWMHNQKDGLQAGNNPVPTSHVGPAYYPPSVFGDAAANGDPSKPSLPSKYPYMMIPTHMTMDMFMFMGMYGVTDRLTLMGMLNYANMDMPMLMDMGNQPGQWNMGYHSVSGVAPMNTGGLGDTEVDAIYTIHDSELGHLLGTLGLSIPTGSTTKKIDMMGWAFRAPYDMQLGSGTVDLKPALTYMWTTDDGLWNLGGQASGIVHMGTNHGWAYGNSFKFSTWGQRAFGDATTWIRLAFTDTAKIRGEDPKISCLNMSCDPNNVWMWAPTPDADPNNYGGQILNAFVGASYQYNAFSIGVEGGVPAYQNLNGLQLQNSWQITGGFQAMF